MKRKYSKYTISNAIDNGAVDSNAIDSGAKDNGAIDSNGIDSGAIDSNAIDNHNHSCDNTLLVDEFVGFMTHQLRDGNPLIAVTRPIYVSNSADNTKCFTLMMLDTHSNSYKLSIELRSFGLELNGGQMEWLEQHKRTVFLDKVSRIFVESCNNSYCNSIRSESIVTSSNSQSNGKSLDLRSKKNFEIVLHSHSYLIAQGSWISATADTISVYIQLKVADTNSAKRLLIEALPMVVELWLAEVRGFNFDEYYKTVADQRFLRELVEAAGGIAFVADGSNLCSVNSEMESEHFVVFQSPESLARSFDLPFKGSITGMLIPKGVTVIVGSGFHGKSTFLKSLALGYRDKVPGHGLEFVVSTHDFMSVRLEEGRHVSSVNISPFFEDLPAAVKMNPSSFSTKYASGSTSMAASVIEAIELDTKAFLLDEDTCASNFLVRDSRMRSLVTSVSTVPFIYRVNGLYYEHNISTIIVVGGCGDWLDVQDTTLMMKDYHCLDMTKRAKSISKAFCTGRVQYNGRGLVHQLTWPLSESEMIRKLILSSVNIHQVLKLESQRFDAIDDPKNGTDNFENLHYVNLFRYCFSSAIIKEVYQKLKVTAAENGSLVSIGEAAINLSCWKNKSYTQAIGVGVAIGWLIVIATEYEQWIMEESTPVLWQCLHQPTMKQLKNLYNQFLEIYQHKLDDSRGNDADHYSILSKISAYEPFELPTASEFCAALNRFRPAVFVRY